MAAYNKRQAASVSGVTAVQGTVAGSISVLTGYILKHLMPDAGGDVIVAGTVIVTTVCMGLVGFLQHLAQHYLSIMPPKK